MYLEEPSLFLFSGIKVLEVPQTLSYRENCLVAYELSLRVFLLDVFLNDIKDIITLLFLSPPSPPSLFLMIKK